MPAFCFRFSTQKVQPPPTRRPPSPPRPLIRKETLSTGWCHVHSSSSREPHRGNNSMHSRVSSVPSSFDSESQPSHRLPIRRRFVLLWKRINTPTTPRRSLRFSFLPPGFEAVAAPSSVASNSSRRRSGWSAFPRYDIMRHS
ncbi:hypothetical protein VKT23_005118 [Stygiomarasmius scandens]|uniref:Uncharacterized protein n=1 Tax=Marasmiellus scandens TaxID=2682957 RepID=A0ABR1JY26_9AGAR